MLVYIVRTSFFHGNSHPAPLSEVESEAVAKVKPSAVVKSFHQ
jgi:hypothetical protein